MMEIKFKRDTAFRKQFFVPNSFAHPAKMDAQLLIWCVERYSKVGETILDPMAGSGTMMLACTLGRNVILVELEEKFCKMMHDNWEKVLMRPQLGSQMGECQIILGDARQLEGLVDKVITSPPYGNRLSDVEVDDGDAQRMSYRQALGKVDKIVTSPPYEHGASGPSRSPFWERLANDPTSARFGRKKHPSVGEGYSEVDSIITSPPYEAQLHDARQSAERTRKKVEAGKYKGVRGDVFTSETNIAAKGWAEGISQDPENIGNLKSDSYLEAMLQVYQSCYNVLKENGLMILVTKNFIRNKQVVRLDTDTIKLCEQAGFSYLERHYRKLPSQSFWRIIYHQKHPEVEQINHEDVLVFKK